MFPFLILISLIDLDESAAAGQIQANIAARGYLRDPLAEEDFAAALANLLGEGLLAINGEGRIEVEYAAYGRILELAAEVPAGALSTAGRQRAQEVAVYAAQVFVDEETWAGELAQERALDAERAARELLLEQENAAVYGYPYDILLQARQTKRGRSKIYVVLLHGSVRHKRGLRAGLNPALPAVYVGLTNLSPQQRFQNHKANRKAGRGYVRDYGICLLPDLYEAYNPMPAKLAAEAEKALAEKLRREGYMVLGGH